MNTYVLQPSMYKLLGLMYEYNYYVVADYSSQRRNCGHPDRRPQRPTRIRNDASWPQQGGGTAISGIAMHSTWTHLDSVCHTWTGRAHLASLAIAIDVHPYILMVAATLAASCAFMLPVATPPNAVVFGSGYLRIWDMVRAGIWMNIVSILLLALMVYYFLPMVWDIPG